MITDPSSITLLSTSLPDLLPMKHRSPGIHLSDIIRYICIERGYFDESTEIDITRLQLGNSLEWAIVNRYKLELGDDCCIPGELEYEGIPGTPDLLMFKPYNNVKEIKYTDRSCYSDIPCEIGCSPDLTHPILSTKFWKEWAQLAGYCRIMVGITGDMSWSRGTLEICHAKGDYKSGKVYHNIWERVFSKRELDEYWMLFKSYKRVMEKERNQR